MARTPVHQKADIITRGEGAALKGLGILLIASHNLAHTLGVTGHDCNEYNFEYGSAQALFDCLAHPGPNILLQLSTLLGYCGIYIFLFMSAFGLVRKYEQGTAKIPAPHSFVWKHYTKLFKLMIIGLLAAILVAYSFHSPMLPNKRYWVAQMLMVTNCIMPPYRYVFPGPYWFLGLMMELYIIYRLVLYVPRGGAAWRRWLWPVVFAIVCLAPQIWFRNAGREMILLRYNFFVAGLSFSAGLLVARYGGIPRMSRWAWAGVCTLLTVAFIVMQKTPVMWIFSSIVATAAMIALVKSFGNAMMKPFVWVGGISSFLFIMHPVVRFFALEMRGQIDNHLLMVLYMCASLLAAVAYRRLLSAIHWK